MDVLLSMFHVGSGLKKEDNQYDILASREDSIPVLYALARALRVLLSNTATRYLLDPILDESAEGNDGHQEDGIDSAPT